ncbi:cucumber peeling cupredoxin [Brachypodium distachyon]|uniref:Phytocyanin domain-containing protein n=1 Tax=Brachypodium distachyon TaxID=15368 RepID=I1HG82_BRADI|nr:cucumber peeling cupredoxin [Brachypodium distachyon]KQK04783.1 hypothetical protein BRADI_2g15920v3 [Brachypodium distachyon]|eukprot:XP_003565891.1 cucumber peeling cupredoxin [Brachypodium distachyon]
MASNKDRLSLLLAWAVMASLVAGSSAGIYHIVGAAKGWRMAPNRTYYAEWARTRNISIGDKLMFLYRSGVYNIVEVPSRQLFEACSMRNITNRYQNGPTIIELTQPGQRYYFCGVGKHCEEGQKLAINVSAVPPPPPVDNPTDDPAADSAAMAGDAASCCLIMLLLASSLMLLM